MSTSAHQIAGELRLRLGADLGPLKLHKLLYFCQGHHLEALDSLLFTEAIRAYDHGPVVSPVWGVESRYGPMETQPLTDEAALNTVAYVLSRYGNLSARDLRQLTHSQSPWIAADASRKAGGTDRISDRAIRDYFREGEGSDGDLPPLTDEQIALMLEGAEERLRGDRQETSADDVRAWAVGRA